MTCYKIYNIRVNIYLMTSKTKVWCHIGINLIRWHYKRTQTNCFYYTPINSSINQSDSIKRFYFIPFWLGSFWKLHNISAKPLCSKLNPRFVLSKATHYCQWLDWYENLADLSVRHIMHVIFAFFVHAPFLKNID